LSLVNINHYNIVIIYKTTKKHNQQKVDCKLWTDKHDKHIKMSTKNLQFSDQNSSWKIVNLQFSHDREITCLVFLHSNLFILWKAFHSCVFWIKIRQLRYTVVIRNKIIQDGCPHSAIHPMIPAIIYWKFVRIIYISYSPKHRNDRIKSYEPIFIFGELFFPLCFPNPSLCKYGCRHVESSDGS
jgi:hypothetical protein